MQERDRLEVMRHRKHFPAPGAINPVVSQRITRLKLPRRWGTRTTWGGRTAGIPGASW